ATFSSAAPSTRSGESGASKRSSTEDLLRSGEPSGRPRRRGQATSPAVAATSVSVIGRSIGAPMVHGHHPAPGKAPMVPGPVPHRARDEKNLASAYVSITATARG